VNGQEEILKLLFTKYVAPASYATCMYVSMHVCRSVEIQCACAWCVYDVLMHLSHKQTPPLMHVCVSVCAEALVTQAGTASKVALFTNEHGRV
jgi:hypothetical protein